MRYAMMITSVYPMMGQRRISIFLLVSGVFQWYNIS